MGVNADALSLAAPPAAARRWKVLVTAPRAQGVIERYQQELGDAGCDVVARCPVERLEEEDLLPLVSDVDGIICGDDRITSRVLDAAPRLRAISKWGTGIDSIDVADARRRGIAVLNSPGAFSEPVADTVMAYVLLFARKPDRMADDMRAGKWQRLPLVSLGECTLGIVGLGESGRAVARRAAAFGMRTLACDVQPPAEQTIRDLGISMVPLDALLRDSDFVTLHADLRPDNRHLIDASKLALMKPTAVLINTARGGLVDEQALIAALRERRIAGAALDVFEHEPLPETSLLRTLDNVYLAPHNANASALAAERVHANSIRNLLDALSAGTR
jgi:D-3-phosphoglycerate dehydrogenase